MFVEAPAIGPVVVTVSIDGGVVNLSTPCLIIGMMNTMFAPE
jgi:hypothetical protein